MTIKELYDLAVKNGCKNAEIFINYDCEDSWYNIDNYPIEKEILTFFKDNKKVFINFN